MSASPFPLPPAQGISPILTTSDFAYGTVGSPSPASPASSTSLVLPPSDVAPVPKKPTLFRSASARHSPYPTSPASTSGRSTGRSRSATSASDFSGWDSESSVAADLYGSSIESRAPSPPSSCDISRSATTDVSPYVVGTRPRTGKDGKPTKSHTRKLDPGYIKRPPNAFILFRSHCCAPELKGDKPAELEPPGTVHARHLASLQLNNSQHVSVIVSQVWKSLPAEDKAYWEEKARLAKEEHQRLHPEYRYRPKQRAKEGRRKQTSNDPTLEKEERQACKEVARQVLQLEGVSLNEADDDSSSGDTRRKSARTATRSKRRTPKKASTLKRSPKRPASRASVTGATSDLPDPLQHDSLFGSQLISHFSAEGESSDFAPGSIGSSYSWSTAASNSPEPFAFMRELNAFGGHSPAPAPSGFALDPALACVTSSRPGSAYPAAFSAPPGWAQLASFPMTPPQTASPSTFVLPVPPPAFSGPDAEAVMGDVVVESDRLAPMGIQFNPASPFAPRTPLEPVATFSAPLAERRSAPLPAALLSEALQRRRSTIRASSLDSQRGDLMLISPMITTEGGRRQSLGFCAGLRRLSAANTGVHGEELPTPRAATSFPRHSLSAGILSATETFEAFTFPQNMLESLPAEDIGLFDLFTTLQGEAEYGGSPSSSDGQTRPSTSCSTWSDSGVERMEGDVPLNLLERRRSTLVPIKFSSPFACDPAQYAMPTGYHIGPTDFFSVPDGPVPNGLPTGADSPDASALGSFAAFGSPELGNATCDLPNPPAQSLLPSLFPASPYPLQANDGSFLDVPVNVATPDEYWSQNAQAVGFDAAAFTGSSMIQQPAYDAYGSASSSPEAECQYVYLTAEQLQDTALMARIHE